MSNLGFDLDNDYFANQKFFSPTAQETVKVWVESENDSKRPLNPIPIF